MNRASTPIPEPVAQLQRQLEQFRGTQPRRTKLPESLWQAAVELARQHGVYSVAHPLRLDHTRLKKRVGGSSNFRRKATKPAFVELVAPSRVQLEECVIEFGVLGWKQDANPVEGHRSTRLDIPAAGLAGNGRMIQITAQMRVLVAIEPVDGRKYAPSIDMRSRAVRTPRISLLRDPGRRITFANV